jgi:hypothetical protein
VMQPQTPAPNASLDIAIGSKCAENEHPTLSTIGTLRELGAGPRITRHLLL